MTAIQHTGDSAERRGGRRPTVLIVDDDESFVASLEDALGNEAYDLLLAHDGETAQRYLDEARVDLVVTDLRMPKMDGLSLVGELSRRSHMVPCIVMTAFGTPDLVQRIERMGVLDFIDKPLDVADLRERIRVGLEESGGDSHLRGLSVTSFLQLLALERKTCTVRIKRDDEAGMLFFRKGTLLDASLGDRSGLEAALDLVAWDNAEITLKNHCPVRKRRLDVELESLLLEAMRLHDEKQRESAGDGTTNNSRRSEMALESHLQDFRDIKGYLASGIMDFTGETLVTDSVSNQVDLEATGAVFNDIFRSAHEASGKIGLDACTKLTLTTPKGLIVMQCSGVDAASHLHFIVVLEQDGNQALARKTLEKIVPHVVAEMS